MSTPLVSILLPTYSRPQWLERAMASIVAQRLQNWEVLVIHDGISPDTSRLMKAWQQKDARVRYFHRPEPTGIASAMNFGLERAQGEYIAILDDDDIWVDPDKLDLQARFLASHPDHVACGGGAIVVDQNGDEKMRYLKPGEDEVIRHQALVANPFIHSTMMYRRDRALEVGGYDSRLHGFHDWDLWLRLGKTGRLHNFLLYFTGYTIWPNGGSSQSTRTNAQSAIKIVMRHRKGYRGFPQALAMAWAYRVYAALPVSLRANTFAALSRMKKRVFSVANPNGLGDASAALAPTGFRKDTQPSSALTRES